MNNVTFKRGELKKIQGVAVKKIKLKASDFANLKFEGNKLFLSEPVLKEKIEVENRIEEPVKVEMPMRMKEPLYFNDEPKKVESKNYEDFEKKISEMKHEKETPAYMNERAPKLQEYSFDEIALKERVAESYKNLANFERKPEKKIESVQRPSLNEKVAKFEKLLCTDVTIMQDKMDMFRKVFDEKQAKLQNAKQEQAKFADSYRRMSNDEQLAKADKEVKESRTKEMNNKNSFTYLTIGENESGEIVEAISVVNESLKNLYNINQRLYKEIVSKIERFEFDKKEINRASEKAGTEIHKYADELGKFIDEKTPLLEDIIKVDNQYKDAQKESERAIKDEYDAITEEEKVKVGINLTMPNQVEAMQNLNQSVNVFENFRSATSEGGDGVAVGINDTYNYVEQPVGFRRAA